MSRNSRIPTGGLVIFICMMIMQLFVPRLLLAGYNMSLTANPSSIAANGYSYSTLTAIVDNDGAPVHGVPLTFTKTGAAGVLQNTPMVVYTDANGTAIALLFSNQISGNATVTCTSNLSNDSDVVKRTVYVNFYPMPTPTPTPSPTPSPVPSTLILTANPTSVAVADQTPSTITAQLYDQYGNTISKPGVSVDFNADSTSGLAHFENNSPAITVDSDGSGKATASLYSPAVENVAVTAALNGNITAPIYVQFTGSGPAANISLTASRSWIPADGTSYTTITASIMDSSLQPVLPGTAVSFTATPLGVFQNGKKTFSTVTPDATGTVTVYYRSANTYSTGTAVITCSAGSGASATINVQIVLVQYESGSNSDMSHADTICFNNVFLGQLSSPFAENWYTFTTKFPSRISINFIATAIPSIAGDCTGASTVGTYRIDIRDGNNDQWRSYQNIDCTPDNGIWQIGVDPGTYYVVVYCPRIPDASHYLSTEYYLAVFNDLYIPCSKTLNAASLYQENSTFNLSVPMVDTDPNLWLDLQYDPMSAFGGLMFKLKNYGVVPNLSGASTCNISHLSAVDGNYVLHVPVLNFAGGTYQVDLTYIPTMDGNLWFMLTGAAYTE